jgi:hypothetical protein
MSRATCSCRTIVSGFAAATVGLSMLSGALPAAATSTTSFAPTSQSSGHDDDNWCWDVDFYKRGDYWFVTWRDLDGKHKVGAGSFRDVVDKLKDECDRVGASPSR